MRCPWCGSNRTKVVDSRPSDEGASIRRRRECEKCGRRFTTFERAESVSLVVIKRDGAKQAYDRAKLRAGISQALVNRPVTEEQVDRLVEKVGSKLLRRGPTVTSQEVGVEVLSGLRALDQVAYMRFASVYKDFQEITDFERELGILLQKKQPKKPAKRR